MAHGFGERREPIIIAFLDRVLHVAKPVLVNETRDECYLTVPVKRVLPVGIPPVSVKLARGQVEAWIDRAVEPVSYLRAGVGQ